MLDAFNLLDARDKLPPDVFTQKAGELGLDEQKVQRLDQTARMRYRLDDLNTMRSQLGLDEELADLAALVEMLDAFGLREWCEIDLGIVRGLAYYTGTVFEVHEVSGMERALAGGGRYDNLIELFGGPATPAVGFGMGDVVLTNVLADKGLVPASVAPPVDAFVLAANDDAAAALPGLVATLRRAGLHTRMSYRTTRNVGKLLKEAEKTGANIRRDRRGNGRRSATQVDGEW